MYYYFVTVAYKSDFGYILSFQNHFLGNITIMKILANRKTLNFQNGYVILML